MNEWTRKEGSPTPLGVQWLAHEQLYNFALYSKHATGVTLLLYSPDDVMHPVYEIRLNYLVNKSGRVWHCALPAATVGRAKYYGYRVEGPINLQEGHRFDPGKVLLDPYARAVYFPPDFSREAAIGAGPNDGQAPLGIIDAVRDSFDWRGDKAPRHAHEAIIYELHVEGFTRHASSGVAPEKRGTYAGIIEKIPYLKELGITVVELMPVHQRDPQENNYWGYMTLSFFAPENRYSSIEDGQQDEFRAMVKALHAADIEVVLDVVYNHTAEGDQNGPCYSFRGIDNTTYYLLEEERRWYRNDTGCGNTLHTANRYVRKLIVDSLQHWVRNMHVDGFRFDLASVFSRNSDGSINLHDPPVIAEISGAPELANVRLIAEAWDMSAYQLGRSFAGHTWLQWNGKFRDDVRAFVKGDQGMVNAVIARLYGSDDLFPDELLYAYHANQSVNFVTSHDGFCLYDLVSYDHKHNEANGQNNNDGTDNNVSWNCGWEGDSDVPADVLALRKRQVKNFCCLLFLSNGTPMFSAGAEFLQTQRGNNNPYNQDNETTWLDWDKLQQNRDIFRFFKYTIAFRKAHPSLGRSRFWREDCRWYGVNGEIDRSYFSHSLAFCLHGASQNDADIYAMINAWNEDLTFTIQEGVPGSWCRLIDTALPSPEDICEPGERVPVVGLQYTVKARSVVVLLR